MSGCDKNGVRFAPEELGDTQTADLVDNFGDGGQVWDEEPLAQRSGPRLRDLDAARHHTQAAGLLDRRRQRGGAYAAEHRELQRQATSDELSEARLHEWSVTQ
jgi:hypothetical protein